MKRLITLCLCLILFSTVHGQNKKEEGQKIADETWVYKPGEKKFKIVCCNEEIFSRILTQFQAITVGYKHTPKTDRHGRYMEITIYFNNKDYDLVTKYISKL